MSYYVEPFTFVFETSQIQTDNGVTDIDCSNLYDSIKLAQASEEGILYERIAQGSGLNELGPGVQVGITVELLGSWQIKFPNGNYIARVAGGNLIGGPNGDPIAYSPGVQALLIQSASSTVTVVDGSGTSLTAEEIAQQVRVELTTELNHLMSLQNGQGLNSTQATMLMEIYRLYGLDPTKPLIVTKTNRFAGSGIVQNIATSPDQTTITRV